MPGSELDTQSELDELRERLAEMEQTLEAIRSGQVDAVVTEGPQGPKIYTLETPDQPYRELVEQMSEGAASISEAGTLLFCNKRLAEMVGRPLESLIGSPVGGLIAGPQRAAFVRLLDRSLEGECKQETELQGEDGRLMPVQVSLRRVETERGRDICLVATDLTGLKEAEQALRHQAQRYDALVSTTSDGYLCCDLELRLLDVNENYCSMSGYSREELLNVGLADLEAEGPGRTTREQTARLTGRRFVRFETLHRRKDGSSFDVEISASHLQGTSEILVFVRNVSRRKKAEDEWHQLEVELRTLNSELEGRVAARTKELEDSNKELESFNYAIAHDLRSPLRHIGAHATMLAEEAPAMNKAAKEHLEKLQHDLRYMSQLIEDLLSLAKAGRQQIQTQTCGLEQVVKEVVKDLGAETQNRQIEWRIQKLPYIDCDPVLIKQVLMNIISNAVKFTKFRPVATIDVGCAQTETETVIFVSDNGVGFNMQFADKLFGIFQRLHRQEDFGGTGVGLAIVQRLIQKHGGRVWAEAELNKGATFYFSLPRTGRNPA